MYQILVIGSFSYMPYLYHSCVICVTTDQWPQIVASL